MVYTREQHVHVRTAVPVSAHLPMVYTGAWGVWFGDVVPVSAHLPMVYTFTPQAQSL